ncbi:MAG: hypothetical protein ACPG49_14120 [Chitinophagales bacterium]
MSINDLLKIGLISLPVFVAFIRILTIAPTKNDWNTYILHLLIPFAAVIVAYFIFQSNQLWAIILYLFIIISQSSLTFHKILDNDGLWIPITLLQLVSLIVFISIKFTIWDLDKEINTENVQRIDTTEIDQNFEEIQQKFVELDVQINSETSNLESIIEDIKEAVKLKNNELTKLNNQQTELKEQLEYYKESSKIYEKQLQKLIKEFNKSKYLNYIFGFFVGIISSFLAFMLFEKMKKSTDNKASMPNKS